MFFSIKRKIILILYQKQALQAGCWWGSGTSCRAVPREGPVPCTCARVQGTGEPSAQGFFSYTKVPGQPSYRWSRPPALGPRLTRPPAPALAMPRLMRQKAEFHGLTDLGAGVSRVLPQAHSQAVCNASWQGQPGQGSGWAGLGPSGQSHSGSLATVVPPAVPLKASP